MIESTSLPWNKRIVWQVRPALWVMQREVRDQFRDWRVVFPIFILTLVFPALMNFTAERAVSFVQQYGAPLIAERFIPFLLMIVGFFPISVSLVMALESFVGEKERQSIEPLICSPLNDGQIYFGKLLASLLTPLAASYFGIFVYLMGTYWRVGWKPEPILLIQVLMLTTVQALVMVSGAVVISSQTTSVRAANLLASFVIIPVAFLIQWEAVIMFWGRFTVLWWIIIGQVIIAALLVRTGVTHFNREELLGRELDTLNLRWIWNTFRHAFIGQATSILDWYRTEISAALRKMYLPMFIMVVLLASGLGVGIHQARIYVLPTNLLDLRGLDQGFLEGMESLRLFTISGAGLVWMQNVRAILLATIAGVFSFGVLGVIILMLPLALIGYFMASLAMTGLSPLLFFTALVLPHGILEIPAMIFAGAALLHLGATLAAPAQGKSVGEAWLCSLGDWAKVVLGIVLPLFFGAALLEVLLTPRIAVWLLGG